MSENRRVNYKFGAKGDKDARRKERQDNSIQLRKSAREEQMLKRRNVCMEDVTTSPLKEQNLHTRPNDYIMTIDEIYHGVHLDDEQKNYDATQSCRKMLSRERNPPIDDVIQAGVLPRLVSFLSRDANRKLQFEAAWALTNIASGHSSQTRAVVEQGAVPSFVRLLSCGVPEVVEQAVWALGNIAGDGPDLRDMVLDAGIIQPMKELTLRKHNPSIPFLQNISWTMSNLCRNKSPPTATKYIQELLPALIGMLQFEDKQIRADTCWAFSYITDGPNERIQMVLDSDVVSRVITMMNTSSDVVILTPALRTAGNIVTGTDAQTETMLQMGLLNVFPKLLRHPKANIVKEAAWTLSNITAGTVNQIDRVLEMDLMGEVINVLSHGEFKAKKEATWAVTNLTSGGKPHQMKAIIELGVLEPLARMLTCNDVKIVQVILDGVTNMLNMADTTGCTDELTLKIEEANMIDEIEKLQEHANEQVYNAAFNIVDTWFKDDDLEEQGGDPNQFSFAPPQTIQQPFAF